MKGFTKMLVAVSASVLSMSCQACVSTTPHETVRQEAAVPPTAGMTLSTRGNGPSQQMGPQSLAQSVHIVSGGSRRFSGTPVRSSELPVFELTGQPADFEISSGYVPTSTLGLSWTNNEALTAIAAERSRKSLNLPSAAEQNIAAEIAFSVPKESTGLDFDLGVAPRVAVRDDGEIISRRVGGEVRIGQNLNITNSLEQPKGWYIFAGADGEALIWDAAIDGLTPSFGGMSLSDKITVGDLQAGVSIQRAGGELSLSYIHREVRYSDRNGSIETKEDFAGISFTMRR
ncbi:MAG: lipid A-modifier LpxR family protein [Hyphomonas sp.]